MKNIFIILICILYIIGCRQKNISNTETVKKYFDARNSVDFNEIKTLISDSIAVTEGDYIMPYTLDSYYEVFKWDSVFQSTYEIVNLKEINQQVIASVALNSIRNEFLQNSQMTCQFKLTVHAGKISKIESLECKDADWGMWQKRVNSLVNYIKTNHPDLDGFIHDMTMDGAKNYIQAIRLYQESKSRM